MMRMVVFCVAAAAFGLLRIRGASAQQSAHDDSHSGHESAFGHAAVYSMEAGVSNIIAIAEGAQGDVGQEEGYLAFMLVPATTASSEGLEEAEEAAEDAWESFVSGAEEATILTTGESATPSETDVYQVALEDPLALVTVELLDAGAFALLLEHSTDEVQVVVTSPSGAVLAAAVEEGGEEEEGGHDEEDHRDEEEDEDEDRSPATSKQWANALIASTIVSLCSFAGLLVMMSGRVAHSIDLSHACIFASGALLTASLLHIVPEALEGLRSEYGDNFRSLGIHAGLALLIGITFGVVVHALLASSHSHGHPQHCHEATMAHTALEAECSASSPISGALRTCSAGVTVAPVEDGAPGATQVDLVLCNNQASTQPSTQPSTPNFVSEPSTGSTMNLQMLIKERSGKALLDVGSLQSVCWTVIIGDFVHNFADGITIGAAFLGCSPAVGWTVTASTIVHEVPHELADFMALIKGGMSAYQAAVYNFISALSAIAGVVLILSLRDALTSAQTSSILLVGAQSFLFVALSELVPEALEVHPEAKARGKRAVLGSQARKLGSFMVGALIIGVPLIFDQHCDAGHDGHDH